MYDLILIGSGPAAAAFARLAPRSLRILLIDGGGRPKPRGGVLAPHARECVLCQGDS